MGVPILNTYQFPQIELLNKKFCEKYNGKIQFLYFDSKNNDFLLKNEDEIMKFWIKRNQKRVKKGKKAWEYWYL